MRGLLIPFAVRRSDQVMVSPDEVQRGLACECDCPGCRRPLVARHGTKKIWHFSHHRHPICADGYFKSILELAKQLVSERLKLRLPSLSASESGTDVFGITLTETVQVLEKKDVTLEECGPGSSIGDVTPDLVGRLGDREIIIMISVAHRVNEIQREQIIALGLPCIEIDLGRFRHSQATRFLLETALFEENSNRHWLHHPKIFESRKIARERLEDRLKNPQRGSEHRLIQTQAHTPASRSIAPATNIQNPPYQSTKVASNEETPPIYENKLYWRASLPEARKIQDALSDFVARTGIQGNRISDLTNQITRRGQLVSISPEDLALEWSLDLNVEASAVSTFLIAAGYVMPPD